MRWRPIAEFGGDYEVSENGVVRRARDSRTYRRGWVVTQSVDKVGYVSVTLKHREQYGRKRRLVHRLVAEAFIGPCPEGEQVNHKDLNKKHNHWSNLEYVTQSQNLRHAIDHGARVGLTNVQCHQVRLLFKQGISRKRIAEMLRVRYGPVCDLLHARRRVR